MRWLKSPGLLSLIVVPLWLVCWSGSDFIKSWYRHDGHMVGEGVFLAVAILLMLGGAFTFISDQPGSEIERCADAPLEPQSRNAKDTQDIDPQ